MLADAELHAQLAEHVAALVDVARVSGALQQAA